MYQIIDLSISSKITYYVDSFLYVAGTCDVDIIVEELFKVFYVADSSTQYVEL